MAFTGPTVKGPRWQRVIRSSPMPMPVQRFQRGAQDQGGLGMKRHASKRSGDFLEMENPQTNHHCYLGSALSIQRCSEGLTVFYFTESSKPPNVLLCPQFFTEEETESLIKGRDLFKATEILRGLFEIRSVSKTGSLVYLLDHASSASSPRSWF